MTPCATGAAIPAETQTTTTRLPVPRRVATDRHPLARLAAALDADGVHAGNAPYERDLPSIRAAIETAVAQMEDAVLGTDRTAMNGTVDPKRDERSIAWVNGCTTVVTVADDGSHVTIDEDGVLHQHSGIGSLTRIDLRHTDGRDPGSTVNLAVTLDPSILGMPSGDEDGRRTVHVARTVAGLLLAAIDTAIRTDATRIPRRPIDLPEGTMDSTGDFERNRRLASIAGTAALIEADLAHALDATHRSSRPKVRMRRPTCIAPARCRVEHGRDETHLADPDARLPMRETSMMFAHRRSPEDGATSVTASLKANDTIVIIDERDPLSRLRLMALAERWRTDGGRRT